MKSIFKSVKLITSSIYTSQLLPLKTQVLLVGQRLWSRLRNIKPVIEKVYSFGQAVEAYPHLANGAFGKNVIMVS